MTARSDEVHVARRFRGPPTSGNGGYVCGLLAEWVDGPAEVTLHAPPPLEVPLHRTQAEGVVTLAHGETLLATARPLAAPLELDVPPPPDAIEIEAAGMAFPGSDRHLFPGCFVCGPDRAPGDGLCLFTGESPHRDVAVADWLPAAEFNDIDGFIAHRFIWAALDCPSYFGLGDPTVRMLLARMEARIARPVSSGERLRVTGWKLGSEGRKHRAASVLHDEAGDVVALARALWIEPRA